MSTYYRYNDAPRYTRAHQTPRVTRAAKAKHGSFLLSMARAAKSRIRETIAFIVSMAVMLSPLAVGAALAFVGL